jgi:hypothetical protein
MKTYEVTVKKDGKYETYNVKASSITHARITANKVYGEPVRVYLKGNLVWSTPGEAITN